MYLGEGRKPKDRFIEKKKKKARGRGPSKKGKRGGLRQGLGLGAESGKGGELDALLRIIQKKEAGGKGERTERRGKGVKRREKIGGRGGGQSCDDPGGSRWGWEKKGEEQNDNFV